MFKTYIDYEGCHPIMECGEVAMKGEVWSGDGISYRVYFAAEKRRDVELWLKGVKAMQKLLRAALTKGR